MSIDKKLKGPFLGIRHLQALLLFFNKAVVYFGQSHVSVTIVAMMNAEKSNPDYPEYKWTEKQRNYILSSLFVGELLTQIPGAYWIRRYGVKINLFIITLASGIFNALVPLCVPWGSWKMFCILRFLQGLFQACAHAAFMQHLANWSPPDERNRLGGFASAGRKCGVMAAVFFSGVISASSIGWPGVFYTSALLSLAWCILWLVCSANNVNSAKCISEAERTYIDDSLDKSLEFERKSLTIPWCAILKSKPFRALLVMRTAEMFGYFEIQAQLPAYINGILQLNIKVNALYSALPYMASFLMTFVFMGLADLIAKKKLLSLTTSRKCFNSIALWLPAAGLIWISFLNVEQKTFAIVGMTIFMSSASASLYGGVLCSIELAPNHTEVIVVMIHIATDIALILGPLFAGVVVTDVTNRSQWQTLFAVTAGIYCLGDLVFLVWGTCKEQPWNSADKLEKRAQKRKQLDFSP